nr:MMPL family transporter [Kibdelosporangium sp. MJ126-NF4]CEL13362.1 Transmembrane transport protein MmpL3 [Kibdelosporangium sp. MJ126-NF4]CTQ99052.1 Transmembrane transport protein MmpL3 [Kibdelosporangium sp. MJ126-NF4]
MIHRWGKALATHARFVLLVGLLLTIAAVAYGGGAFATLSDGGFVSAGSESSREVTAENELFGNKSTDVVAMYSSDKEEATQPAFEAQVREVMNNLPPHAVTAVTTYYDNRSPQLLSGDRHSTRVLISLAGEDQDARAAAYAEIKDKLRSVTLRTEVTGRPVVQEEVSEIVSKDLVRAEMIASPIVLLLSLLIFGSLVAALMPVLVGALAVVGALATVRVLTMFTEVSVFSVNVITMLGMGLAVDYALFMVNRFREELAELPRDHPDAASIAVSRTMDTAGRTVLLSGLTVAAALSSLLIFSEPFLRSMAYGGIAAVVVVMVSALTVLPAVLRLLGRRVDAGRMPRRFGGGRAVAGASGDGVWATLARSVMRRPVSYLVVTVVGLLALGLPFLGVQWGSVDHRMLPEDAPAHVAADKLSTEFGGETATANLLVRNAAAGETHEYATAVDKVDGVASVQPVAQNGDATLLRATWDGNSQTHRSQEIVREIRGIDPPGDGTVLVSGQSAETVDLIDSVGARLPWMALIMVAVMLVLLFLAFGSFVLPIKAVLMNAVSISAAFGAVTWIFADGHLENLLGFESTGYLDATQPIVMLAVLFGLSMDYEVFLLSRMREEWDRTGDNTRAVATGLQKTGRIITSAALLLAVVIGAFATSGVVFMKMVGIGILVALLVDATIVRALLVPATMKLLGKANWWAPGPVRKWWGTHGIQESPGRG